MDKFYVYAHVDKETQTPFYIGIGQGKRAFDKSRNEFWTKFVSKYSKDYEVKFVAENIDESLALELENILIEKLGKIQAGNGILLNWTDGGYNEGVFVSLSFDNRTEDSINILTEYGKRIYFQNNEDFNISKITSFLNEILENKSKEIRDKTLFEIGKSVKPRNSWIVPFCLSGSVKKSDSFSLNLIVIEDLMKVVKEPINWLMLPNRKYVEMLVHRIMIHFDLILQENLKLEKNGKVISQSDVNWEFYKEYWKGYIKIIQAKNKGLDFKISYIGRNKKDEYRKDIHDFKIETK